MQACGVGSSIETAPCCTYSFAATPGWDASTGLGSPNFGVLANLVLNNQTYFPSVSAYPVGTDAVVNNFETTDSGSDDTVEAQALTGVILGAIATALAISALVYAVFFTKSAKSNILLA